MSRSESSGFCVAPSPLNNSLLIAGTTPRGTRLFPVGPLRLLAVSSVFKFIAATVFVFSFFTVVVGSPQLTSPSVTKVEPPSWWAGHTINPVRLLVRGRNLQDASIQSTTAVTHTSNLTVNEAGKYAFVDVAG